MYESKGTDVDVMTVTKDRRVQNDPICSPSEISFRMFLPRRFFLESQVVQVPVLPFGLFCRRFCSQTYFTSGFSLGFTLTVDVRSWGKTSVFRRERENT